MARESFRSALIGALALQFIAGGPETGIAKLAAQEVQTALSVSEEARSPLDARANLEVRDVPLAVALDELRSASRVSLAYSPSLLPSSTRVSCDCRTATVGQALDRLLAGTSLRFATVREQILIEPARIRVESPQRLSLFASLAATPVSSPRAPGGLAYVDDVRGGVVTGRVSDASTGAPLSGAQVTIVGTQLGSLTAADGRYSITGVPDGAREVRAAMIGYGAGSQRVTVANGQTATANFSLAPEAVALEGIVAIGYGTQERRDVTGAVGSVRAECGRHHVLLRSGRRRLRAHPRQRLPGNHQ
jgi:hypothetical protein